MCQNCTTDAVKQGLGLVGAVIMPHNLFLHSGLVLVRVEGCEVERGEGMKVGESVGMNV